MSRETQIAEMLDGIESAEKPTRPEVRSPMPGTVVTVSATDGARVGKGDTILTVEAMKMEHRLTAPVTGIVRTTAAPGDLVRLDQLLATITTDPATTDPISTDQFSTKEES
jgi:acetyl-CoA/propionyl-CoA carboxylase biotin carboxyl carrier protein